MTDTQQQCLLKYLGYYEGKVDGISGKMTEAAVEAFRKDNGMPNHGDELEEVLIGAVFHGKFKGSVVPETDFWSTVKHFGRHEFACKCGKCGGYPVEPAESLIRVLDDIREAVGLPMYVTSGIRCKQHNANVGGASSSRHMNGDAADIMCPDKTPSELYTIACAKMGNSGGIGLYSWGIHVDTRPGMMARWNG